MRPPANVWNTTQSRKLDYHRSMNTTSNFTINDTVAVRKNSAGDVYEWEYYYDYIEPIIVDESKLKYNKYSIVIILWITLAAFVGFLFLTLNLMSVSGNIPKRRRPERKDNGE